MATKMNANIAKRVEALKINAKNEEEASKELLKILTKNGIDGMEEEDIETLLDIAESLVDESETEMSEEEENDALAEEVEEEEEAPKPKKASKKEETPEVEEEESEETEDEDDSEEGDEFDSLDRKGLKSYIKEKELDIKVKKSMSDDDIREAIRVEIEEPEEEKKEEESEEEEETVAPPKPKKEVKKEKEVKSKKEVKKDAPKKKRSSKLDPKNNEDDRKYFNVLKDTFSEEENAFCWIANAGVTIKHKGKNAQKGLVTIENCSKNSDGSIKCNVYFLTFNKKTEVLDEKGIDYETCWSGAPCIKDILLDEAIEIINSIIKDIESTVKKIDKKLGENRKKMEENLEKKVAPKSKKVTKKVVEEEPENDDEDEEEEEAPKTKKTSKKKK